MNEGDDFNRRSGREGEPQNHPSFRRPSFEGVKIDLWRLNRERSKNDRGDEVNRPIGRIVDRLLLIVREYRGCANRVGSPFDEKSLRDILTALRIESAGGAVGVLLKDDDPVAMFLRESLYQELLEVPFDPCLFVSPDDSGTARWMIDSKLWRDCLDLFADRLDLSVPTGVSGER